MSKPSFTGYPDIKVILRKKQWEWLLPTNSQFDINISNFVTGLNSIAARTNDNLVIDPELGVAMVAPLYANRNNFIENIAGSPTRYKVDVPKGAPAETENEINRRVWIASPTINQDPNKEFKKPDQEFAQVGASVDLSANPVDNTYAGPIWTEESHESSSVGDVTVKRPPPTLWVHQKNSNANTEFFITQKFGLFTNESFWIDIRKYKSESPSNIAATELDDSTPGNRFDRYKSGENLLNYFAIRVGSNTPEDIQSPSGYDIVFPIGGSPFIYDHEGQGVENSDVVVTNKYNYRGFVASKKTDPDWSLPNDLDSFRIAVMFIRGKMAIKSSWASSTWFFPSDLTSQPFPQTQERYENFFMPESRISLIGRGVKLSFNFNPLEFNIYQNGKEKDPHGKITFGPFPVRDEFPNTDKTKGWVDFDERTLDHDVQNYTVIPYDKADFDLQGNQVSVSYGFDFVKDNYPSISGNYTSMMIPVNVNTTSSVREIIKTTMRPPTLDEQKLVKPTGGPEKISPSGNSGPIFKNMFLEVDMNCKHPEFGQYVVGGSDESGFIHRRFASPLLWRLKGRMLIPPLPEPTDFDISQFVTGISYDSCAQDFSAVEQNFTISVRVPKEYEFKVSEGNTDPFGNQKNAWDIYTRRTEITSRNELLNLIYNGNKEVEIWLGYWGTKRFKDGALENPIVNGIGIFEKEEGIRRDSTRVKVFTGLAVGGPINETYGNDIVSLKCLEKTEMLKGCSIMNSPIYDGMLLERAYYHLASLSGLPKENFLVRSNFANKEVLPMGYSFMEPKIKFEFNTPLIDAIKTIVGIFRHMLRTDPDGRIVMTDVYYNSSNPASNEYSSILEDLFISHPDFVFNVDGWADRANGGDEFGLAWTGDGGFDNANDGEGNQSPFKRCYEQFNYDKDTSSHNTQLQIQFVNRLTGAVGFDGQIMDVDAIENPEAKNYIGFQKPLRIAQPAFGEKKNVDKFKAQMAAHILQSPFKVNFTTYGRPTLRAMDIIEVVHQDPKSYFVNSNGSIREVTANKIKYRVVKVSGNLTYTDSKWQYKMDVEAVHR